MGPRRAPRYGVDTARSTRSLGRVAVRRAWDIELLLEVEGLGGPGVRRHRPVAIQSHASCGVRRASRVATVNTGSGSGGAPSFCPRSTRSARVQPGPRATRTDAVRAVSARASPSAARSGGAIGRGGASQPHAAAMLANASGPNAVRSAAARLSVSTPDSRDRASAWRHRSCASPLPVHGEDRII